MLVSKSRFSRGSRVVPTPSWSATRTFDFGLSRIVIGLKSAWRKSWREDRGAGVVSANPVHG